MDEGDKSDPGTEFASDSSWPLGPHDSDNVYFFANNNRGGRRGEDDTTILSEFGWNLRPESDDPNRIGGLDDDASDFTRSFVFPDQNKDTTTGSALQSSDPAVPSGSESKAGEATTSNNPSVSSTSSEDPPEKSTGSGGKPPEIPWVGSANTFFNFLYIDFYIFNKFSMWLAKSVINSIFRGKWQVNYFKKLKKKIKFHVRLWRFFRLEFRCGVTVRECNVCVRTCYGVRYPCKLGCGGSFVISLKWWEHFLQQHRRYCGGNGVPKFFFFFLIPFWEQFCVPRNIIT